MKRSKCFSLGMAILFVALYFVGCAEPLESPLDKIFPENLSEYMTYPKPQEIELNGWTVEITEEEVEAQIMLIRSQDSDLVAAGRPCEKGDYIMIDYYGYIDGELIDAFVEENCETVIGYGLLLPELEEAILGSIEGQVLRVNVVLSDPFLTEISYSGKEVNFLVRLTEVDKQTLPDYTDEWVSSYCGYSSISAFEKALRQVLLKNKKQEYENYLKESIWSKMMDGTMIQAYPEEAWNQEYNEAIEYYQLLRDYQQMTDEELWNSLDCENEEAFLSYVKEKVNGKVKERMLLCALSRQYLITLTEETLLEGEEIIVESLGLTSVEALEEIYDFDEIFEAVLMDKCQTALVSLATILVNN